MKFINLIIIIFAVLTSNIKAENNTEIVKLLKEGNKLVFIRHAYAPGGGDPDNFDLSDCTTQRNLSEIGRKQANDIGNFFKKNKIKIQNIYSSEWCRCKDTAKIAFKNFKTKSFLNSFFSQKFAKNRSRQMLELKKFVSDQKNEENLIFVTHYVLISEALNYAPSSGEIVIADKKFNKIDTLEIRY